MSVEELETEAMKLDPEARARLAGKLLESLEALSDEESERLWSEEAGRWDSDLGADQDGARSADEVLRNARDRLRWMPRIRFHCLAERELNDTARYYELETSGLGRAFLEAVEKTCSSILAHPQAGSTVTGIIRRRLIRRFPYALLYSVRSDDIRVLAVMNLRRRPEAA